MAAATVAKRSPPATATGLSEFVRVPSPSDPNRFMPQQYAVLSKVTPQVWKPPALTDASVNPLAAGVGLAEPVLVPSPNSPSTFLPQQYAAPAAVTAQV
jgi:hypothetical protein